MCVAAQFVNGKFLILLYRSASFAPIWMEFLRKRYGDSTYIIMNWMSSLFFFIPYSHFYTFSSVRKSCDLFCLFRWVHLVCALYTPGVTFDVPEKLEGVVLIDMPVSKWSAKVSFIKICIFFKERDQSNCTRLFQSLTVGANVQ